MASVATTRVSQHIATPWGFSDHVVPLGDRGILSVGTPSHGGIFVPLDLLDEIPGDGLAYAKRWSGSEQWFEEDCAWAFVAATFTELFPEGAVTAAKGIVKGIRSRIAQGWTVAETSVEEGGAS